MNGTTNGDTPTDTPTTPAVGKVEQMNQLVRSLCVVMMTATFCGVFIAGGFMEKPIVSTDAFVGMMAAAITWLFKSRDEAQRRTDMLPPTTTTETRGGVALTKTGPSAAPPVT